MMRACSTLLVVAVLAVSVGLAATPVTLPVKQWVALEMPERGKGIAGGNKHVTGALNPLDGRLYFVGGDYGGPEHYDSYRQETYSLSLTERLADPGNRNAGWRLEYPYCGPSGEVQPKHPDFVGWTWDPKRSVFWMVPGTMVAASTNCPEETPASKSDPGFPYNQLMTFDPASKKWKVASPRHTPGANQSWMAVYDPKTDSLVKFYFANGARAGIYSIESGQWRERGLGRGAGGKELRIAMEYIAADLERRVVYVVDGVGGRLYRYRLDSGSLDDLGAVPGGPISHQNQTYIAWDSVNRVLLRYNPYDGSFRAYHPEERRWEELANVADPPGVKIRGRLLVFDPLHNAVLLFGGIEPHNPHMFLYRYGEGAGTPPAPK